jgi:hypothetical protein
MLIAEALEQRNQPEVTLPLLLATDTSQQRSPRRFVALTLKI